jgi:hypothetical protein
MDLDAPPLESPQRMRLRILEQHSSLASGQLTRVRRQRRAEYRCAVELAAQQHTAESFAQLDRMGAVTEFGSDDIYDSAARAYLTSRRQNQSSLLVAPTWAESETVTETVRAELKATGLSARPTAPSSRWAWTDSPFGATSFGKPV